MIQVIQDEQLLWCTEGICSVFFVAPIIIAPSIFFNTSAFTTMIMVLNLLSRSEWFSTFLDLCFSSYFWLQVLITDTPHHFLSILYPQMTSDTTTARVRPSTLASWSTLPLRWCLWLSLERLTICLTGRTTTNMWSLLCSTWSGALLFWRYGQWLYLLINQSRPIHLKWNLRGLRRGNWTIKIIFLNAAR